MFPVKFNLGKVSISCEGIWEDKEYERLSLVSDADYTATYISKSYVPKGISLFDIRYWQPLQTKIVAGVDISIGENNHWYVNGVDTGINATGDKGLSAYEVWLSLGNEGTEQDFIDSLRGGNFPDAPNDGNIYARTNKNWIAINQWHEEV